MGAGDGMALRGEKKSGPIFFCGGHPGFREASFFFKYEFFLFFSKKVLTSQLRGGKLAPHPLGWPE